MEKLFCIYIVRDIMTKSLYSVGLCSYRIDCDKMSRIELKVGKDLYEIYSFIGFAYW